MPRRDTLYRVACKHMHVYKLQIAYPSRGGGELFTAHEYAEHGLHTCRPEAFNLVDIKPHDTFFFFGGAVSRQRELI